MGKRPNQYHFTKQCKVCNHTFQGTVGQVYCSTVCRDKNYGVVSQFKGIANSTVGAIQEYRVVIDLLSRGYEVYRSTSPACNSDLLIRKNGKIESVEVKTAYKQADGKIKYPTLKYKTDILALALPNEELVYRNSYRLLKPERNHK